MPLEPPASVTGGPAFPPLSIKRPGGTGAAPASYCVGVWRSKSVASGSPVNICPETGCRREQGCTSRDMRWSCVRRGGHASAGSLLRELSPEERALSRPISKRRGYWWLACGLVGDTATRLRGAAKLSHRVAEYGDAMTRPQAFSEVCRSFASHRVAHPSTANLAARVSGQTFPGDPLARLKRCPQQGGRSDQAPPINDLASAGPTTRS
jgi:hypothetical protein